jgi:hypothetical protein
MTRTVLIPFWSKLIEPIVFWSVVHKRCICSHLYSYYYKSMVLKLLGRHEESYKLLLKVY